MSLQAEVAAAREVQRDKAKQERSAYRQQAIDVAVAQFEKIIGERPGRAVNAKGGGVRLTHAGFTFYYGTSPGAGSGSDLHLILTCPECGQEHYAGQTHIYLIGHATAAEKIAEILNREPYWHHCWEKELKELRGAIKSTAAAMKTGEYDVLQRVSEGL